MQKNTYRSRTRSQFGKVKLSIIMLLVAILPISTSMIAVLRSNASALQVQDIVQSSSTIDTDIGRQLTRTVVDDQLAPQPLYDPYEERQLNKSTRSSPINNINGDYWTSNISSVAKPGDVFIQEAGALGITGHAGIIEKVENGKVYTIEANGGTGYYNGVEVGKGVHRYELDSHRFYDRGTTLFEVPRATAAQRNSAVAWARNQIGRGYSVLAISANYLIGSLHCGVLVWGAYYQAGIELTNYPFAMPRDIRDGNGLGGSQLLRKIVSYKGYEFESKKVNRVIDIERADTGAAAYAIIHDRNGQANQRFIEVSSSVKAGRYEDFDMVYIAAHAPSRFLSTIPRFLNPFANDNYIKTGWDSWDHPNNRFKFSNGMLMTGASNFSKTVHLQNTNTANSTKLVQHDKSESAIQNLWYKRHVATYYFNFY
jgi:hypothetical protein